MRISLNPINGPGGIVFFRFNKQAGCNKSGQGELFLKKINKQAGMPFY